MTPFCVDRSRNAWKWFAIQGVERSRRRNCKLQAMKMRRGAAFLPANEDELLPRRRLPVSFLFSFFFCHTGGVSVGARCQRVSSGVFVLLLSLFLRDRICCFAVRVLIALSENGKCTLPICQNRRLCASSVSAKGR